MSRLESSRPVHRASIVVIAGVAFSLLGLSATPAFAAPARVVITPTYEAIARGDDVEDRMAVAVLDETGAVVDTARRSVTVTSDAGCDFRAGEPPSIRTCTVTARYGDLAPATASVQVFDLSVLAVSVTPSTPVIAPGAVLTASAPPAGWPALRYTWRSPRAATLGEGPSYLLTMADIGTTVSVTAALEHGGLAAHYPAATKSASAPAAVAKVNVALGATLASSVVNTKRKPAIDVTLAVPGVGPWSGPMTVIYGSARLETPLVGGAGRITLPKLPIGAYPITVWYQGNEQANAASIELGTLRVVKAVSPTLKATWAAKSVKRTGRAKVKVAVTAKGVKAPTGTVTVTWAKGKGKASKPANASFTLKATSKGKATFALPTIKKKGTYKVTVTFTGNGKLTSKSVRTSLKVR
ncbi:MAG: hypothetical protein LBK59_09255 [Bifidobacteriaceae bacterium]|jgi:hypothetical protein|nr:hypothetical protein [Bifidobacteriaceae bacterium]